MIEMVLTGLICLIFYILYRFDKALREMSQIQEEHDELLSELLKKGVDCTCPSTRK